MKLLIFAFLGSGLHAQDFADVQEMMEYNVERWDLNKYLWCAIHYTMCITQAQSHTLHNIPSFLLHQNQIPHGGSWRRRFLIKPWRLDVQVSLVQRVYRCIKAIDSWTLDTILNPTGDTQENGFLARACRLVRKTCTSWVLLASLWPPPWRQELLPRVT